MITDKQERKERPVFSGVLAYFPRALFEVAHASKVGNDQHNPNMPLFWDRTKSQDELDALTRHLIDHSVEPYDEDGVLHLAKVAWRALAMLEKFMEEEELQQQQRNAEMMAEFSDYRPELKYIDKDGKEIR